MGGKNDLGITEISDVFSQQIRSVETKKQTPAFIEKVRIMLGLAMMVAGLYFGLFTIGASEGLGYLSVLASTFEKIADK